MLRARHFFFSINVTLVCPTRLPFITFEHFLPFQARFFRNFIFFFCEPPFCFSLSPLLFCVPPFSFHACISAFVDFQIHSILPHFSVYHSTQSPLLIYSHLRTGHSFSFKYFIQLHSNSIHSRSVPFQLILFIPILISDPCHVVSRCLPNRSNPTARHLLSMWKNSRIPSRYGINSGRFFSPFQLSTRRCPSLSAHSISQIFCCPAFPIPH